jgi:hypothetical protein
MSEPANANTIQGSNENVTSNQEFKIQFKESLYLYLVLCVSMYTTLNAAEAFTIELFIALCSSSFLVIFGGYVKAIKGQEIKVLLQKLKEETDARLKSQRIADSLESRLALLKEQNSDLQQIKQYLQTEIAKYTELLSNPEKLDSIKQLLSKLINN